jgi:hypothetical protein
MGHLLICLGLVCWLAMMARRWPLVRRSLPEIYREAQRGPLLTRVEHALSLLALALFVSGFWLLWHG